jgi:murein DD-endopeptidase MepM/ murein hydrolase activator NlpD
MGEIQLPKHLAPAVVRRTQQNLRPGVNHNVLSRAVRVGAGAAFLAVYAFGFQGASPVVSSGQAPAEAAGDIAVNLPLVSAAVAEAAHGSVSSAGVGSLRGSSASASGTGVSIAGAVSASADAFVSYSRTVVFTEARPVNEKLDVVSTKVRRPAAGSLMAPLEVLVPTSHFGLRTSPISGAAGEFHWGQDFAAACGTNVFAADAGVVRAVGWHPWGGGNRVEIDHGNGLITTYNHLEGIGVKKGQSVQVGQLIAKVGTTGSSTGCHLHFETILNGKHTDPDNWTLLRLRHSGPVANIKMTDYRKAGTATETPNWAVPVGASAQRSAVNDASAHGAASVKSASTAKASASAAKSRGRRAAAPTTKAAAPKVAAPKVTAPKVTAPKPAHRAPTTKPATPAPAPKVTPKPATPAPVMPKPAPTSAPTPKPTTPAPTPAPAPTVTPAPAATQAPAPAVTPAPAATPTPAPSPSISAAPKAAAPKSATAAPAAAPAPAATPAPVATPSSAPTPSASAAATSTPAPVQAPQQLTRKQAKEAESAKKSKATAAAAATETAAP